jgi:hypothetical protein
MSMPRLSNSNLAPAISGRLAQDLVSLERSIAVEARYQAVARERRIIESATSAES